MDTITRVTQLDPSYLVDKCCAIWQSLHVPRRRLPTITAAIMSLPSLTVRVSVVFEVDSFDA